MITVTASSLSPRSNRGITLVEVMIAMVLGLILLGALSNVFIGNMQTRTEIEKVGRQIENGRYAMQLLLDDLSNAGFFSGASLADAEEELDFCSPAEMSTKILLPAVARATAALSCTPDYKPGTSIIVIRRFSTTGQPTAAASNCSDVFPTGVCIQVEKSGAPYYGTGVMDKLMHDGVKFAPIRVPVSHIYYVDTSNNLRLASLSWAGGVPSFPVSPETIVEGIEMLGLELSGKRARVEILARSASGSPKMVVEQKTYVIDGADYLTNDNIRRQFYSATANIDNQVE